MQIVYERCAGLDVHKKSVVACLLFPEHGHQRKERQTFSTMTPDVVRLRDWLKEHDCTCVAMESTGVFWKPIYNLLEGHVELLLVNAQHIKAVPGRKTDVKDAKWIADLLRHGQRGNRASNFCIANLERRARARRLQDHVIAAPSQIGEPRKHDCIGSDKL